MGVGRGLGILSCKSALQIITCLGPGKKKKKKKKRWWINVGALALGSFVTAQASVGWESWGVGERWAGRIPNWSGLVRPWHDPKANWKGHCRRVQIVTRSWCPDQGCVLVPLFHTRGKYTGFGVEQWVEL